MNTVKDLRKHLDKYLKNNETIAWDIWTLEDVFDQAKNLKIKITKEQAIQILETMQHRKDASIGLNWDVLTIHIEDITGR
jgi:hypothetical protein